MLHNLLNKILSDKQLNTKRIKVNIIVQFRGGNSRYNGNIFNEGKSNSVSKRHSA